MSGRWWAITKQITHSVATRILDISVKDKCTPHGLKLSYIYDQLNYNGI
jgi:hypothetical protein